MVAEIIPLIRLPRSQGIFDFLVPETLSLKPGMIVTIPFRATTVSGLVWRLKGQPSSKRYTLKRVLDILGNEPTVNLNQLQLIRKLADRYFTSLSVIAELFVPEPMRRQQPIPRRLPGKVAPSRPVNPALTRFLKRPGDTLILTHRSDYPAVIARLIVADPIVGQTMIIVPDFRRLATLVQTLPSSVKQTTIVIHGGLAKGALNEAFATARANQHGLIIGTRRAVFAPHEHVKAIWLIDEDDPGHKQADLNPRFDVATVIALIAQTKRVPVRFTAVTPSLSIWRRFSKRKSNVIRLGSLSKLSWIDFQSAPKDIVLTPTAEQAVNQTDGRVLVLVNQKGEATTVRCADCGQVLVCPHCQHVLAKKETAGLACTRCRQKLPEPTHCPRCRSTALRAFGFTVTTVARRLSRQLEEVIGTVTKEKQTHPDARVVVGTEHAFNLPTFFTVAVVPSLDQLLTRPTWDAEFRVWQLLGKLRLAAERVIVQTRSPDHPFIEQIQKGSWRELYDYFWNQRQQWHYPPAWQAIKLLYRSTDRAAGAAEANRVVKQLNKKGLSGLEITGPFTPFPFRRSGKYSYGVLLRWHDKQPPRLGAVVRNAITDEWQVDVNPHSLN